MCDARAFSTIGTLTADGGRPDERDTVARRLRRRQKGMRSDQSARPVAYNGHRSRLGCESRRRGERTAAGKRRRGVGPRVRAAAAVLPRTTRFGPRLGVVGSWDSFCTAANPLVPAALRIITPHVRGAYAYNIITHCSVYTIFDRYR